VLPADDRPVNIGILGALVASTEQQHDRLFGLCVIDTVTRPDVDPSLPDPRPTEPMVAKIPQGNPIDTTLNSNTRTHVAQRVEPVLKQVTALGSKIVQNLHATIFAYKRNIGKGEEADSPGCT